MSLHSKHPGANVHAVPQVDTTNARVHAQAVTTPLPDCTFAASPTADPHAMALRLIQRIRGVMEKCIVLTKYFNRARVCLADIYISISDFSTAEDLLTPCFVVTEARSKKIWNQNQLFRWEGQSDGTSLAYRPGSFPRRCMRLTQCYLALLRQRGLNEVRTHQHDAVSLIITLYQRLVTMATRHGVADVVVLSSDLDRLQHVSRAAAVDILRSELACIHVPNTPIFAACLRQVRSLRLAGGSVDHADIEALFRLAEAIGEKHPESNMPPAVGTMMPTGIVGCMLHKNDTWVVRVSCSGRESV